MGSGFTKFTLLFSLGLAVSPLTLAVDAVDEIRTCAKKADRDARFECYESLGKRVLADDMAVKPKGQPEARVRAEVDAEPSTVDLSAVDEALTPEPKKEQFTGNVTSCTKARDRKLFFYFENGQVWKEVHRGRPLKDCNFPATITKGVFGYKMEIDEREGKFRVSRKR